MSGPPDAVVTIVTYNSASDIAACVASLATHYPALRAGRAQVHVVDNASTDGTRDILEQLEAEHTWLHLHVLDANIGFGPGNNVVLRNVPATAHVLLNADAWLVGDSLSPAVAQLTATPKLGVIGLPLIYPDGGPQTYVFLPSAWHRWLLYLMGLRNVASAMIRFAPTRALMTLVPFSRNFVANHAKPPLDLGDPDAIAATATLARRDAAWVAGAAMVLAPDFVAASQGFDPDIFLYGEDEDLCLRAHRLGFAVQALHTIPIVHKLGWGGDTGFRPRVARLKYDSLRVFIAKNVRGAVNRGLMRALLPLYVYGRHLPHFFKGPR